MKYHYTYWLTDENGRSYIGSRSCVVHPCDDEYFGSSLLVKDAIKNGMKFTKTILAIWPSREDATSHEVLLHEIFDVAKNRNFYNRARQTSTKFIRDISGWTHNKHTRKILSQQKSGKNHPNYGKRGPGTTAYGHKHTEAQKKTMALYGSKNGMFGKSHSDKSIQLMKDNRGDISGSNNPFFGKKHKEESKKYGSNNHMFGVTRQNHPNAKRVHTPVGIYECVLDAAEALNVSTNTIRNRIKSNAIQFIDYYFEEKHDKTI